MLANISRSKGNQAMKFGQLIKYTVRKVFLQNHAADETGRLVPGFKINPSFLIKLFLYVTKNS